MNDKLAILYFEVTDLWKRLCEEHNELFNITCDEYSLLLNSELSLLDDKLAEKNTIILKISALETIRRELIKELNSLLPEKEVTSVSELLEVMRAYEVENQQKHLFRFNALLIDIIEKIQAQNKIYLHNKNNNLHFFLNSMTSMS